MSLFLQRLLRQIIDWWRRLVSPPAPPPIPGLNINPDVHSGLVPPDTFPGLGWVRLVFKFDAAHTRFNGDLARALAFYDRIAARYLEAGTGVLFILNQETLWGNAPWSAPNDIGGWTRYAEAFAALAGSIAAHYASHGTAPQQIAFELWNEGDLHGKSSVYYPPEHFATLLKHSVPAIRAANPDAPVILGGLAAAPHESIAYLQTVRLALGGRLPVDALGLHPYGKWPPPYRQAPPLQGGWFGPLADHLQLLTAAFPDLPCWITEVGLSEDSPLPPDQWPEAGRYLRRVFALVQRDFAERVPVVIWFAWSDEMRNAGLIDADTQPKGALYDAFARQVRAYHPHRDSDKTL